MQFIKKLFGETPITWKFLIIYSVVTGVVVGLLNCVPFLANTSFVAPAVTLEYWFVAAIFIISNCKSWKEAVIKTFLFFLISQPMIYLVEVPFKEIGWGLFGYYKYWGVITLLTIPGSLIAYQIKRDNVISSIILSIATGFLLGTGCAYIRGLFTDFPNGIVASIFCIVFSILLVLVILKKKKTRIIAYVITAVIAAGMMFVTMGRNSSVATAIVLEPEHTWEIVDSDISVQFVTDNTIDIKGKKNQEFHVTVKNEKGEMVRYEGTLSGNFEIKQTVLDQE